MKQRVAPSETEHRVGLQQFVTDQRESGSQLFVLLPDDQINLIARAFTGDAFAKQVLLAGRYLFDRADRAKPPVRCCCCGDNVVISQIGAVSMLIPAVAEPEHTTWVASPTCKPCIAGLSREQITAKIMGFLVQLWPKLREIPAPTHPEGGRA